MQKILACGDFEEGEKLPEKKTLDLND